MLWTVKGKWPAYSGRAFPSGLPVSLVVCLRSGGLAFGPGTPSCLADRPPRA